MYKCPVCFYDGMTDPPQDYHICDCCGTEFGNDDEERSHSELRWEWIALGAKWFFGDPPTGWNPWKQSRTPSYVCVPTRCHEYSITFSGTPVYLGTPGRRAQTRSISNGSIEVFADTRKAFLTVAA